MKLLSSIISLNLIFSSWLYLSILPINAQSDQIASQDILSGDISISTPDFFSFDQVFFSNQAQTVQKILDPNLQEDLISVTDLRSGGGFTVDARISDLTAGTNSINHQNVGFISVALASPNSVDITPDTLPNDIVAPLDLDWDFSSPIDPNDFTPFPDGGSEISDPLMVIEGSDPMGGGRVGRFEVSFGLSVNIPALQEPGLYQGELTITLNT